MFAHRDGQHKRKTLKNERDSGEGGGGSARGVGGSTIALATVILGPINSKLDIFQRAENNRDNSQGRVTGGHN